MVVPPRQQLPLEFLLLLQMHRHLQQRQSLQTMVFPTLCRRALCIHPMTLEEFSWFFVVGFKMVSDILLEFYRTAIYKLPILSHNNIQLMVCLKQPSRDTWGEWQP